MKGGGCNWEARKKVILKSKTGETPRDTVRKKTEEKKKRGSSKDTRGSFVEKLGSFC